VARAPGRRSRLPHPPSLVPEVAAGAAPELHKLRDACAVALRHLADSGARSLVVVGSGPADQPHEQPANIRYGPPSHPFGAPVEFTVDRATAVAPQPLPLSLLVAAWLLREMTTSST